MNGAHQWRGVIEEYRDRLSNIFNNAKMAGGGVDYKGPPGARRAEGCSSCHSEAERRRESNSGSKAASRGRGSGSNSSGATAMIDVTGDDDTM